MSTFEQAIPVIMAHEGTPTNFWVNDPDDPGGETVWGWSMLTIKRLGLQPNDLGLPYRSFFPGVLKEVSRATCESLYRRYFWAQYGYQNIDDQTAATKIMDAAVNMGPGRAATFAQNAVNKLGGNVGVDGKLGKISFAAINACDPKDFVKAYAAEMEAYYRRIVDRSPRLGKFLKNWLKRAQWGVQA